MGNACRNSTDFEPFQNTGGEVRVLIVGCGYRYDPKNSLAGIRDGLNFQRICRTAEIRDVTFMRDDLHCHDLLFPTAEHVLRAIAEIGRRCNPEDFFVFFFAGHADIVEDVSGDEEDGFDSFFCLPGPNYESGKGVFHEYGLLDDDFASALDESFDEDVRLIVIADCCHSAGIADVDSFDYSHRICCISACQDAEESSDLGFGGVLTISIEKAVAEMSFRMGAQEYSLLAFWQIVDRCIRRLAKNQSPSIMCKNMDLASTPWPMPQPWWRYTKDKAAGCLTNQGEGCLPRKKAGPLQIPRAHTPQTYRQRRQNAATFGSVQLQYDIKLAERFSHEEPETSGSDTDC